MKRFRLLRRTQRDLADILEFIGQDNPSRAASFVSELVEHVRRLAEQPLTGHAHPEMGQGIRSMPHGRCVIFYRPRQDGISVYRVIHGSRDMRWGLQ